METEYYMLAWDYWFNQNEGWITVNSGKHLPSDKDVCQVEVRLCKRVIPWSFNGGGPTAVLNKESSLSPLLFLIPACPTHVYSAFCSGWRVPQTAGQSEASHQLYCLSNTRWITAEIPFHPLSRIKASRQPNPIQEKAPINPSSPQLQLQNLIPAVLPLVYVQLGEKPVQRLELAKNECH